MFLVMEIWLKTTMQYDDSKSRCGCGRRVQTRRDGRDRGICIAVEVFRFQAWPPHVRPVSAGATLTALDWLAFVPKAVGALARQVRTGRVLVPCEVCTSVPYRTSWCHAPAARISAPPAGRLPYQNPEMRTVIARTRRLNIGVEHASIPPYPGKQA